MQIGFVCLCDKLYDPVLYDKINKKLGMPAGASESHANVVSPVEN